LVLLACVEAEHHTLPLAALAAALGANRIPIRMLGAATPTQSLVRAVRDIGPAAVVLWAQRPDTAGLRVVQALLPYPVRLLTAGPGWPAAGSESIEHLTGLRHALTVLVGPSADPGDPDDPDADGEGDEAGGGDPGAPESPPFPSGPFTSLQ
ncbi:MAG TPA: hypothetical protein VE864_09145, partial [Streptosporangiaceae bacterium]|nr:hypothetical protein [Streptosporangiaceae bacterium]